MENVENKKTYHHWDQPSCKCSFSKIQGINEHDLQRCDTLYKTLILRIKEQLKLLQKWIFIQVNY